MDKEKHLVELQRLHQSYIRSAQFAGMRHANSFEKSRDALAWAIAELQSSHEALEKIRRTDLRSRGTSSEDHFEFNGPCGEIAASVLYPKVP